MPVSALFRPTTPSPWPWLDPTRSWPRSSPNASHGHSEAAIETAEKLGFDTGLKARHPLVENCELPIYVANFVLMEYGTRHLWLPGHDQRDLDFTRKYGLNVVPVVAPQVQTPVHLKSPTKPMSAMGRWLIPTSWTVLPWMRPSRR